MATRTLGTTAQTSLTAINFSPSPATLSDADLATIVQAILSDTNTAHPIAQQIGAGGFSRQGVLILPDNRGAIIVKPGDFVGVDTSAGVGWPILVSANAIANGAWTHT